MGRWVAYRLLTRAGGGIYGLLSPALTPANLHLCRCRRLARAEGAASGAVRRQRKTPLGSVIQAGPSSLV